MGSKREKLQNINLKSRDFIRSFLNMIESNFGEEEVYVFCNNFSSILPGHLVGWSYNYGGSMTIPNQKRRRVKIQKGKKIDLHAHFKEQEVKNDFVNKFTKLLLKNKISEDPERCTTTIYRQIYEYLAANYSVKNLKDEKTKFLYAIRKISDTTRDCSDPTDEELVIIFNHRKDPRLLLEIMNEDYSAPSFICNNFVKPILLDHILQLIENPTSPLLKTCEKCKMLFFTSDRKKVDAIYCPGCESTPQESQRVEKKAKRGVVRLSVGRSN